MIAVGRIPGTAWPVHIGVMLIMRSRLLLLGLSLLFLDQLQFFFLVFTVVTAGGIIEKLVLSHQINLRHLAPLIGLSRSEGLVSWHSQILEVTPIGGSLIDFSCQLAEFGTLLAPVEAGLLDGWKVITVLLVFQLHLLHQFLQLFFLLCSEVAVIHWIYYPHLIPAVSHSQQSRHTPRRLFLILDITVICSHWRCIVLGCLSTWGRRPITLSWHARAVNHVPRNNKALLRLFGLLQECMVAVLLLLLRLGTLDWREQSFLFLLLHNPLHFSFLFLHLFLHLQSQGSFLCLQSIALSIIPFEDSD